MSIPLTHPTSSNSIKYNDSDVNSKRRKLIHNNLCGSLKKIDEYQDFEKNAIENDLNSSFKEKTWQQNLDFKGGFIETSKSDDDILLITTNPSMTSRGFENTFKLLETQVGKSSRTSNIVIESICQNIPIKSRRIVDNVFTEPPEKLELELLAIERINSLVNFNTPNLMENQSLSTKNLADFLWEYTSNRHISEQLAEHILKNNSKEYADIIYHASRGTDGKHYLKVIRNLWQNKVLCGNRVSQMTRAYDDIEAVTRLLEEKEKDLELTVQIGKELLTQNNSLENKIINLEAELRSSNDDRAQLLHELHKKNELIAVLTNDADDGENDSPTLSKSITLDLLQKKIASLQDENKSLKMEASQLACQTDEVEEQERKLMTDITLQLNETNSQYDHLSLELERQREENRLQHDQIVSLTTRLAEAEMRLHQLTQDNDEHLTLLNITKENQNCLALELVEFKQRYQEVLSLLQEAQEQLRKQRKKVMPHARSSLMSTSGLVHPDSLQSELMELSLYSQNSLDSGIAGENQRIHDRTGRLTFDPMCYFDGGSTNVGFGGGASSGYIPPYKRIFDTVRCASKNGVYSDSGNVSMSQLGAMSMSSSLGPRMSSMPFMGQQTTTSSKTTIQPPVSFYRNTNYESINMDARSLSYESLDSHSDDGYPSQPSGVPGAPGAKDLEAALKRLTPAEVLARRAMLSYAPLGTYNYDDQPTVAGPHGIRTPDSIMSTGSSGISSSTNMSSSLNQWRLPEKLQIVKPIEGSQTLNHWSRLATPTLSGLLEERPGVTIRGGRGLDDLGIHIYTLSDVEEDVSEDLPGKQFEPPGCIYTYTMSTVMHPDDGIVNDTSFLSQSQVSSRMASTSTSRQPSCPLTPKAGLSRRNSCSTFSVNNGLATVLNERGIKAVTPSALNTPAGPNFTPTVTPCNSPEGTPRSMSPEPLFGILASGADLIRRKLVGSVERSNRNHQKQQKIMLSRLERRALRSLKLVEKVESIGLENIISTHPNAMCQLASGIANRSASPMAQLTSLKHMHSTSNGMMDDLHFDRDQIKGVLSKGLNASDARDVCESSVRKTDNDKVEIGYINDYNDSLILAKNVSQDSQPINTQNIDVRSKQMYRQKSRRNLKNGIASQRPDLGTITGHVRKDLGKVSQPSAHKHTKSSTHDTQHFDELNNRGAQSITQSFVGSVSSLLFGRKGGWL